MKVQIRQGVFETNSSSTHSISICSKTDWEAFEHGKLYYNTQEDKFLPADEAAQKNTEICKRYEAKGWYFDDYAEMLWMDFESYYNYIGNTCYESFSETKTVDGVEVVVFGYYGSDY
jgi:hypothetical protein